MGSFLLRFFKFILLNLIVSIVIYIIVFFTIFKKNSKTPLDIKSTFNQVVNFKETIKSLNSKSEQALNDLQLDTDTEDIKKNSLPTKDQIKEIKKVSEDYEALKPNPNETPTIDMNAVKNQISTAKLASEVISLQQETVQLQNEIVRLKNQNRELINQINDLIKKNKDKINKN